MMHESARRTRSSLIVAATSRIVFLLSVYVVPAAILVLSIVAALTLESHYPAASGQSIAFRVLPQSAYNDDPFQALVAMQAHEPQMSAKTSGTTWFMLNAGGALSFADPALLIPAPETRELSCWDADTMAVLGKADRDTSVGPLRPNRRGFLLELDGRESPGSIICKGVFAEPGVLTAELWSLSDLKKNIVGLVRGIGLLEGGLLTLAIFCIATAISTRELTYVLLAAWLVGNLRLGAFALGWDTQWLGYSLPPESMPLIRRLTIATYYLLTHTLFTRLFGVRVVRLKYSWLLWITQAGGVLLLAAAFVLSDPDFYRLMWLICGLAVTVATWLLVYIFYRARRRIWLWHTIFLAMSISFMLSATLMASFGRSAFLDLFNGTITLLLPNVMVALAVGQRLRNERSEHVRAKIELVSNYAITPIGTFTLSADNRIERANPVLQQMLGFSLDDGGPVEWTDYFEPQDWRKLSAMTHDGQEVEIKLRESAIRPGGPQHFVVRVATEGGKVEGSLQDITARTRKMNRLRLMAHTDPLTEVLNRRGIEKALARGANDRLLNDRPFALGYMDLDHFKRINGLFGHTAGDEVLKQVCHRVSACLTGQQQLGRIGGDEFMILFADTSIDDAGETASKIILELQRTAFYVGGRAFHVKSALGVVELAPSMNVNRAFSAASRACRDARKRGQPVVVYEHGSLELQSHAEELRIFGQLQDGKAPPGFYLEMQPILSLQRPLQSLNVEVLLRVRNSTGNLMPAGKVIEAAEDSGTVTIIDKWVFKTILEWLSTHEAQLTRTKVVSVNLSGVSINDDRFIEWLFGLLGRYGHLASRLCVEITEGVALQNFERTQKFITRLQAMGVRIALDDFGAGYTSFSYLKELRADAIKIDGTLIRGMMSCETSIAVVRTIVELARNLGMKSIVEWVEDADTLRALQEMGADYAQGWAISAARPTVDILNAKSIVDLAGPDILDVVARSTDQPDDDNTWSLPPQQLSSAGGT